MKAIFLVLSLRSFVQGIDERKYRALEKEFGHYVYEMHHSLQVYWKGDALNRLVREQVEWFLQQEGTPEARYLLGKYQELDWDVQKMLQFHLLEPW